MKPLSQPDRQILLITVTVGRCRNWLLERAAIVSDDHLGVPFSGWRLELDIGDPETFGFTQEQAVMVLPSDFLHQVVAHSSPGSLRPLSRESGENAPDTSAPRFHLLGLICITMIGPANAIQTSPDIAVISGGIRLKPNPQTCDHRLILMRAGARPQNDISFTPSSDT